MRRLIPVLLLLAGFPALALERSGSDSRAVATAQSLPLTPQMFGAKGDGHADDSAAIEAWLQSGQPLFCSGKFRIGRGLTVDLKPLGGLHLQGAGRQLCVFVLAGPQAGVTIHGGRPDLYRTPQVVLRDLSFAPAAMVARPALEISYEGGSGSTDPTLDLRNVAVKPVASAFSAASCLRLDNVRNGVVEALNCEGRRDAYMPGSRGIVVTGDAQPVELTLRDINVYYFDQGIALDGTWQGVAISEMVCVACRVGVRATASDDRSVWLRVFDSHFNVTDFGVETVNIANVQTIGNFVYLNEVGDTRAAFRACFALTMVSAATAWSKIANNTCDGSQSHAAPKYGVYLDSKQKPAGFLMESRIDGNSFYQLDWGVYLANTTAVTVGSNTFAFMAKGDIWNGSSGSGIFKNMRSPPDMPLKPGAN